MKNFIQSLVKELYKLDKYIAIIRYQAKLTKNKASYGFLEDNVMDDLPDYIYFIMKYFYRLKSVKTASRLYFKLHITHDIPFETI